MIKLLLLLNLVHWAADFTQLSSARMLNAKRFGKPLFPILMHACVHASLVFVVILIFNDVRMALILAAFQLVTHFIIDTLKGKMNTWFTPLQNLSNTFHWWIFGADQYLHQVVIILTAYWASR